MSEGPEHGYSAHRIEALTDGVYAVAMTLLVMDLKLPDGSTLHGTDDLQRAVLGLAPRFEAWLISFLVLALFWFGHHRTYSHLRRTDGRLIAFGIAQLALVSLMPFCCALIGEYAGGAFVQAVYSLNMAALGMLSFLSARYVYRRPEMTVGPMSSREYVGACLRTGGLIVVSLAAVALAWLARGDGNRAYLLMAGIVPLSRWLERRRG